MEAALQGWVATAATSSSARGRTRMVVPAELAAFALQGSALEPQQTRVRGWPQEAQRAVPAANAAATVAASLGANGRSGLPWASTEALAALFVGGCGLAASLARGRGSRRSGLKGVRPSRGLVRRAADSDSFDLDDSDGFEMMTVVDPDAPGQMIPRLLFEGTKEVDPKGKDGDIRPSGKSSDPDNVYFWKMARDKRTIEVIFPIDSDVRGDDIVFRLGEDPDDDKRGPTLELGYRRKSESGRFKETLVIDGQILHAINRGESMWMIEEMSDVKVCILTLQRPTMLRRRHDPILKTTVEEERIEPQTWDALLVEERIKPEITDRVYFDISLEGKPAGRMEFGLFGNVVPKTVKNFLGLVTGKYVDDSGNTVESAFCLKGNTCHSILRDFMLAAGNPGLDKVLIKFSPEDLKEYLGFYEDFRKPPLRVGKVEKDWAIRWGADLGLPVDSEGYKKREGEQVDGNSENELNIIIETMRELDVKGKGAEFIFLRPEWEKGCDVTGSTFPAEGFKVTHSKRGMLSMDRNEDKDKQGSVFFVTLREFPEMDKRWVVFGEVTSGLDLLSKIEDEYEGAAKMVKIEDCGVITA